MSHLSRLLSLAIVAFLAVSTLGGCFGSGTSAPERREMPLNASWEGQWQTTFGPLIIEYTDDGVVGVYQYGSVTGVFLGQMDGNLLAFKWAEQEGGAGTGYGVFAMSDSGTEFYGVWGYGESPTDGGEWTGSKVR